MKSGLFPHDVRVIFPRVPLTRLAGGLLLLSGGLSAMPVSAQTSISTPQTPTFTATNAGTPYTILNGATFDGGGSGVDGFDADGSSGAVSVTVNGGDFSGNGGDGLNANANTTVTVNADTNGDPDATFTNNVLNGLETAGMATITAGSFNGNGSGNTTGSDDSGLQADSGANVTINGGTFDNNGFNISLPAGFSEVSDGNGVEADGATLGITNGEFNANGSFGVLVQDGTQATISGGTFNDNGDQQVQFGGFGVGAFGSATSIGISGGSLENNINGGFFADAATVGIQGGAFNDNGNYGAWVNDGAQLTVDASSGTAPTFDNNSSGIGLEVDEDSDSGSAPAIDTLATISAGDYSGNGLDGLRAEGGATVNISDTTGALLAFDGSSNGSGSQVNGLEDNGAVVNISAGQFGAQNVGNSNDGVLLDSGTVNVSTNPSGTDPTFEYNGSNGMEIEGSTATITAGSFNENSNDGLYASSGSTININTDASGDSATFNSNANNGAEIEDFSAATITDGTFDDNGGGLRTDGNGDGLFVRNSSLTISPDVNSGDTPTFDNNNFGISTGDSSVGISGGDYSGNFFDGALVFGPSGSVTISADPATGDIGTFDDNGASGLQVSVGATATITAGMFTNDSNSGVTADTGAIVMVQSDPSGVTPTFDGNYGAGLQSDGSTVTITAGEFDNTLDGLFPASPTAAGGDGVRAFDGSTLNINTDSALYSSGSPNDYATFDGNSGNGVDVDASTATITDGLFSGNTLWGVLAEDGSTLTIEADPTSGNEPTFTGNGSGANTSGDKYDGVKVDDSTATITGGNFYGNGDNGLYAADGSKVNINSDSNFGDFAVFQNNGTNGVETDDSILNITDGVFGGFAGTPYSPGTGGNVENGLSALDGSTVTIGEDPNSGDTPSFDGNGTNGVYAGLSGDILSPAVTQVTVTAGDFSYNVNDGLDAGANSNVTVEGGSVSVGGSTPTVTQATFTNNTNGLEAEGPASGFPAAVVNITAGNFSSNTGSGILGDAGSTINLNSDPNGSFITDYNNYDGVYTAGTLNITDGGYSTNVNDGVYGTNTSTITVGTDPTTGNIPNFFGAAGNPQANGLETDGVATITGGYFDNNAHDGLLADSASTVTVEGDGAGGGASFYDNGNAGIEAADNTTINITAGSINDNANYGIQGGVNSTINLNSDLNATPSYIGDYANYDGVYTDGTANITDGDYYSNTNDGVHGSSSSTINVGSDVNSLNHPLFAGQTGYPQANGLETAGTANISSGVFEDNTNGVLADSGATVNITPDTVANNEPYFGSAPFFPTGNTNDGLLANGATINISDGGFFGNGNDGIQGDSASTINSNVETINSVNYFASFNDNSANGLETAGIANITAGNFNTNSNDGALGDVGSTINVNPSINIADFSGNVNGLETAGTANVNTGQFNGNTSDGLLADAGSTVNVHDSSFTPEFENNANFGMEALDATVNITAGQFTGNASNGLYVTNGTTLGSTVTIGTDTDGATPSFDNNVDNGVSIEGGNGATTATISAGDFSNNQDDGLFDTDNANVTINGGTFDDNGTAGPGNDGVHVSSAFGVTTLPSSLTINGGDFSGNVIDGVQVDSGSTATISGGTFNGLPAGGKGTAQQNGVETAGTTAITGGTFNGNSNDGVKADTNSNVTINDPPSIAPTFDLNGNDGFETAGTATINAGNFSDNMVDGLAADLGADVTVNGGTFDTNLIDGLLATGSSTDVYLYGGSFLSNGTDLSAINDSTIYVYGTDLAFSLTPALPPSGVLDPNTPPFPSGFITGYLASNPNTLVSLSYNVGSGGNIILQGNGNGTPTVPEPSPLMLATLPLGGLLVLRARRRRAQGA